VTERAQILASRKDYTKPNQRKRLFFADGQGTKHALAEILANKSPEELGFRLPPKRRAWMSEHSRMDIFDAVALVLMLRLKKAKRTA
jgi:hypothetical protein